VRLALACLACTAACGFRSPSNPPIDVDAPPIASNDAGPDAPIDAPVVPDAPIDAAPGSRVRTDLIGLWVFDEPPGVGVRTAVADTSDSAIKVPLAITFGTVTFADGSMTPDGEAVIASAPKPHLNSDVIGRAGVTLEAWVSSSRADQGTLAAPAEIAGLSASVMSRNVSLLQIGTHWVARMRSTADKNGGPDLISTSTVVPGQLTHIVVVADATQRVLYIDGQADRIDPAGTGAPLGWDMAYRMTLGNEFQRGGPWAGTFALVAMYRGALSKLLIDTNFKAGANAP